MQLIKSNVYDENCYLIETINGLVIIDPGYNFEKLKIVIGDREPIAVLLTHFHFDHVAHVNSVCQFYDIKAYIHNKDFAPLVTDTLAELFGVGKVPVFPEYIKTFEDSIPEIPDVQCLHTPGHSRGSVMFKHGIELFTGDALFKEGVGRVDVPGGDANEMKASIEFIKTLPNNLIVYPGHGDAEAMVEIKKNNSFLK